ncbi:glycoside hydrolase family 127 protein [Qingshengfaniella alkalisoli]|uniref:Glycoside hydrolase family 127 protein n=1 Tax=Qingshengfaniella alkalisoli TaxID=2599296 RepID=A0A5B8IAF0_9RHOB|nr:beta-L-arabinofuranosidase domain-containing protein [Qingshengfaniella alkalisoli]QDY71039.1 glycoside hydrolase family 127 protein [Qingshengfaniella alkalisoli]
MTKPSRKSLAVPFTDVELTGAFWKERLDTVLETTIPTQYAKLEESGIRECMKRRDDNPPLYIPRNEHGFTQEIFRDSDAAKWIEAASYALRHRMDDTIVAQIEGIIDDLEAAQEPDGYLNLWYLRHEPENRWTNLRDNHELYCAGHMLEGALAYWQATGRRRLLDITERYLDHIRDMFGPEPGKRKGYPGHQEIELALIKLYHATGEQKHLELAKYFIDQRGQHPHYFIEEMQARGEANEDWVQGTLEYNQSHLPVREQTKVVGHAVRAMYMYAAMADMAAETADEDLARACRALWHDVVDRRMYVTGGFGPSASNEGFTEDWDLPNATAYAETCASVAMVFWARRMLDLELDGQYADIMELSLFNGALVGLSRKGDTYFYDNPLESDGSHHRWDWHFCPCCTMNVSRLIASVAGYFCSTGPGLAAMHIYGGIEAKLDIDGRPVTLSEASGYPYDGTVNVELGLDGPHSFTLALRVPGWAKDFTVRINGEAVTAFTENGYLRLNREWQDGDRVTLDLPMRGERLWAHPNVADDRGRVALRRGPLVYCVEAKDTPELPYLTLPRDAELATAKMNDFGGTVAIRAAARAIDTAGWGDDLYSPHPPRTDATTMTAIPYFLWNNRGANRMQVWIPESPAQAEG